jgi:hypothetical protein
MIHFDNFFKNYFQKWQINGNSDEIAHFTDINYKMYMKSEFERLAACFNFGLSQNWNKKMPEISRMSIFLISSPKVFKTIIRYYEYTSGSLVNIV